ncbi:MAG: glycosyltransferase family 4 protein [Bacillota bacterium]|nr:glycosyltransferase family 4 protein [Bacillota bacterium]
MKIILVTDEYNLGGSPNAKRMRAFAEELLSKGHRVLVITSSEHKKSWQQNGRAERVLFSLTVPLTKKTILRRALHQLSFGLSAFISALFVSKPDVVVCTSPPALASIFGLFIAKAKRALLVYDVRDIWPDVAVEMDSIKEDGIYYRLFSWIKNRMLNASAIVTTVSKGKASKLRNSLSGNSDDRSDKVHLIANGFDCSYSNTVFNEAVIRKYKMADKINIVYVGNIGYAQNLDAYLDLAKAFQNEERPYQFLLFGDGAERERLESRIAEERITNVAFHGRISYEDVYSVLRAAHVSFVSLKNDKLTDSIPTKIYDSFGVGCPVFLVASGDAEELIDVTGFGYKMPVSNLASIADAFQDMMDNYEEILGNRDKAIKLMHTTYSRQNSARLFERLIRVSFEELSSRS